MFCSTSSKWVSSDASLFPTLRKDLVVSQRSKEYLFSTWWHNSSNLVYLSRSLFTLILNCPRVRLQPICKLEPKDVRLSHAIFFDRLCSRKKETIASLSQFLQVNVSEHGIFHVSYSLLLIRWRSEIFSRFAVLLRLPFVSSLGGRWWRYWLDLLCLFSLGILVLIPPLCTRARELNFIGQKHIRISGRQLFPNEDVTPKWQLDKSAKFYLREARPTRPPPLSLSPSYNLFLGSSQLNENCLVDLLF